MKGLLTLFATTWISAALGLGVLLSVCSVIHFAVFSTVFASVFFGGGLHLPVAWSIILSKAHHMCLHSCTRGLGAVWNSVTASYTCDTLFLWNKKKTLYCWFYLLWLCSFFPPTMIWTLKGAVGFDFLLISCIQPQVLTLEKELLLKSLSEDDLRPIPHHCSKWKPKVVPCSKGDMKTSPCGLPQNH